MKYNVELNNGDEYEAHGDKVVYDDHWLTFFVFVDGQAIQGAVFPTSLVQSVLWEPE